jgi:serine/threonine protein kinase
MLEELDALRDALRDAFTTKGDEDPAELESATDRLHALIDARIESSNGRFNSKQDPGASPFSAVDDVLVVAGSCADKSNDLRDHGKLVQFGLKRFRGTLVSGGTEAGVSGMVAEVVSQLRQRGRQSIHLVGYLPKNIRKQRIHPAYDKIIRTGGEWFSALEPLKYWEDMIKAGISPANVTLLGIGGGKIAAFEYRLALHLGAQVAILGESGYAAKEVLDDHVLRDNNRLLALPHDAMTVHLLLGEEPKITVEIDYEDLAKNMHARYRESASPDAPANKPWEDLAPNFKESNLEAAKSAPRMLAIIGYYLDKKNISLVEQPEFPRLSDEDIDRLAEMEHARWNLEKLKGGYRYGEKNNEIKRTKNYLVEWERLPQDVREYDYNNVKIYLETFEKLGYQARRFRCSSDFDVETLWASNGVIRLAAYDKTLDRPCYVKMFQEGDRDCQIARRMARLNHPNIERLYHLGHQGTRSYLVLEWTDGRLLHELGPFDNPDKLADLIEKFVKIAGAIHFAHEKGVIHGKLSHAIPETVATGNSPLKNTVGNRYLFVRNTEEKEPLVSGFGLAARPAQKEDEKELDLTEREVYCLAPERAAGKTPNVQTDIWGIGAALYQLVTGKTLYGDVDLHTAIEFATSEDVIDMTPLREVQEKMKVVDPSRLVSIVRKCLEKNPEHRYDSARKLQFALRTVADVIRAPDLETLLWPDTTKNWFDDNSPIGAEVPHSYDPNRSEAIRNRFRWYLERILGEVDESWLADEHLEHWHTELKHFVGSYSKFQGPDDRNFTMVNFLLFIARIQKLPQVCDWPWNTSLLPADLEEKISKNAVLKIVGKMLPALASLKDNPHKPAIARVVIEKNSNPKQVKLKLAFDGKALEKALSCKGHKGDLSGAMEYLNEIRENMVKLEQRDDEWWIVVEGLKELDW